MLYKAFCNLISPLEILQYLNQSSKKKKSLFACEHCLSSDCFGAKHTAAAIEDSVQQKSFFRNNFCENIILI